MKKNEKYQNLIRFLKEKNCYKAFYRNFINPSAQEWRRKYKYGIDTIDFKRWYETMDKPDENKNYLEHQYFIISHNINDIVLSMAFCWAKTKEQDFWHTIQKEIKEKNL